MAAMRSRHVFALGGVLVGQVAAEVAGHPTPVMKDLHRAGGESGPTTFMGQLIGDAVVVAVDLDVVVYADRHLLPVRELVGGFRQLAQSRTLDLFEPALA